jgi:DHA1 family bicyclomycin/chloramphenicol resistance-like MFS transporter
MAGAGGVVLSLAIVRDLYTGTELARVLGSLMLVFGLAPVLAPVGALPFLVGAFLSPLAGLGGDGAATVAGIMLAALCVAGLPCVLLIPGRRANS